MRLYLNLIPSQGFLENSTTGQYPFPKELLVVNFFLCLPFSLSATQNGGIQGQTKQTMTSSASRDLRSKGFACWGQRRGGLRSPGNRAGSRVQQARRGHTPPRLRSLWAFLL